MVNQSCAARLALAPLSRALVFQPRSIRIDFIKASFFLCYALTTATGGSSDVRRFRRLISIAPGRDRKHSLTQSAPAHGTLAAHSHAHTRSRTRSARCVFTRGSSYKGAAGEVEWLPKPNTRTRLHSSGALFLFGVRR